MDKKLCWTALLLVGIFSFLGCAAHKPKADPFGEAGRRQLNELVRQFAVANQDGGIVLIATPQSNHVESGSGFLVQSDNAFYIITAHHVISNLNSRSVVVFRGSNDSPFQVSLSEIQSVFPHNQVLALANTVGDCAVIPFGIGHVLQMEYAQHVRYSTFSLAKQLINAPTNDLRQREMVMTGFGGGLGSMPSFKPPKVRARASTELQIITNNGQTAKRFFLDVPAFQGMSGGPVTLDSETLIQKTGNSSVTVRLENRIVGIITATVADNTGGKFAAITHISVALDLINEFERQIVRFLMQPSAIQPNESPAPGR